MSSAEYLKNLKEFCGFVAFIALPFIIVGSSFFQTEAARAESTSVEMVEVSSFDPSTRINLEKLVRLQEREIDLLEAICRNQSIMGRTTGRTLYCP